MAKPIEVTPRSNIRSKLLKLRPGQHLVFKKGVYVKPIYIGGIRGTYRKPIVFEAEKGAIFTSGFELNDELERLGEVTNAGYRRRSNRIAYLRQTAGYYPSIGQTGAEANVVIHNCQFLILKNLTFKNCWPTALLIDDSQNIIANALEFTEGTFAIAAAGKSTRDLLIDGCNWVQDSSGICKIWNQILWSQIHGASNNSSDGGVDQDEDYRAYDGDFFRAWNIAGNVTIRHCNISDAFNAIHFFNQTDELAPGVNSKQLQFNSGRRASVNVLIEHNTFTRVRDNVIEPEDYAWNWVVRHNTFNNSYRTMSLELKRMAWLYFYGNQGWMLERPGHDIDGKEGSRRSGSLFKLNKDQDSEGNIYFFNNSWIFGDRERVFAKGALGGLRHYNNAFHFNLSSKARHFGKLRKDTDTGDLDLDAFPLPPTNSKQEQIDEKARFTRRWQNFDILMDGDISNDVRFPKTYQTIGFGLGLRSKFGEAGFTNTKKKRPDVSLKRNALAAGAAISWEMKLPGYELANDKTPFLKKMDAIVMVDPITGENETVAANIGSHQDARIYELWDKYFEFLPDCPVSPDFYERIRRKPNPKNSNFKGI